MEQNLIVFGIDVSSRKSNVCIMANQVIVKEYKIANNATGFNQLLQDLQLFAQAPDIVFEPTGIYSDRLQAFLNNHGYRYCKLNPLQAHQRLMHFRMSKTDKHDACDLANSQFIFHRRPFYQQNAVYNQLKAWSHYYDQLTHDLITVKNRLHCLLQEMFPELGTLMTHTKNYYYCVQLFTHPEIVKQLGLQKINVLLVTELPLAVLVTYRP